MNNQIAQHWCSVTIRFRLHPFGFFFFFEFKELDDHDHIWINFYLLTSLSAWLLQGLRALLSQSLVFCVRIPSKRPLHAQLCLTLCNPMDSTHQAPLSMGFPRQEYWSGLPFPIPGSLPDTGIETASPVSCFGRQILYCLSHQGSPMFLLMTVNGRECETLPALLGW